MAQPTTFSEFPRTFSTAGPLTNPSGVIVDTGDFDKTAVYRILVMLSGTAPGRVDVQHMAADEATVVEAVTIVASGAPVEFEFLWMIETSQEVFVNVPSALTGTLAVTLNIYQASPGVSAGWQ